MKPYKVTIYFSYWKLEIENYQFFYQILLMNLR